MSKQCGSQEAASQQLSEGESQNKKVFPREKEEKS